MSRAIITHFDGDPFTLNAWLVLYEKYIRGECDTVYATMYYNPAVVPSSVIEFNKSLVIPYPEIKVSIKTHTQYPEIGNVDSLKKVTEEYVGLIESDGLVYSRGVIDQCFRLLEHENQDIVAPRWDLIDEPYFNGDLQSKGFMRCFFFTKKSLLDRTELDFLPRSIPANTGLTETYSTGRNVALDCFGYMSWQLLLLTRKITYIPDNVVKPDTIFSPYSNFKYIHIRQMSSSALGMGGGEFALWSGNNLPKILDQVLRLYRPEGTHNAVEFTYVKAIAFKLLFLDMMINYEPIGKFAIQYREILETVINLYNLPREMIYEVKGFYKGLFQI